MKDQLQDSVSRVFSTSAAFAAVKTDGSAGLSELGLFLEELVGVFLMLWLLRL